MTDNGWLQIGLFLLLVFLVTKPIGIFMTKVFNSEKTIMDPLLRPVEKLLCRVTGVHGTQGMRCTEYAVSMSFRSLGPMSLLYLMARLQSELAFNPQNG